MPDTPSIPLAQEIVLTRINTDLIDAIVANGFEARFVGGCVRDALLDIKSQDVDIASTAMPDQTVKALKVLDGIKINPFAARYGVIHIKYEGQTFQVSTLREDVKTYGRKADVVFTTSWEKDAKRRDFTVNSIYMARSGEMFDPYDGIGDLKQGRVRFIGDPSLRIQEDYIRILRYFRFWGKLSAQRPEPSVIEAIIKHEEGLKALPIDIVKSEIRKIKKLSNGTQVLSIMRELTPGLLELNVWQSQP
ncbi:MAG: hypothetical protein LBJ03_00010 [Holosporales bacterium]|jgi:poly(A) polymerase|nr:hypothetical protein [Holosporales bacterium]